MSTDGQRDGEGRLPGEVVSLVHHVELNRSGWWDRALERLVLVTVWRDSPTTSAAVVAALSNNLDRRVSVERVEAVIQAGLDAGTMVETGDLKIRTSAEVDRELRAELASVEESTGRLRTALLEAAWAAEIPADEGELWEDFEELFMVPLVCDAGARIYEMVASGTVLDFDSPSNQERVKPLCDKYGAEIRQAVVAFLDPHNADVREYVLRSLNADFVREAAALDGSVLAALAESRGRPDRVRVFVDTNFVFSFLELHDNPSNEVAKDLVDLAGRVASTIKVEFVVLPITVDETRRVLRAVMNRLSAVVPSRNLAGAARNLTSTGLVARYLEAASSYTGRGALTAEMFFGPYESNPVAVLRERGVELHNADLDALRMDQEVIDDLHDREDAQRRLSKRGPKSYEANLHDMVLYHYAERQRPASQTAALEVGSWVCTVDYGLVNFDRYKRRKSRRPPVCLTPSSLVQLLQFWAPRTESFERALVGAIREPLLFLDFDSSTEQTTIRILQSLSRFDGVGDLSTSTIYNVLSDQALRARLGEDLDLGPERETELVEAAFIDQARRMEDEVERLQRERDEVTASATQEQRKMLEESGRVLEESRTEAEALERVLKARDGEVERLKSDVATLAAQLDAERTSKSDERAESDKQRAELAGRLEALESERHAERSKRRGWAVGLLALVGLVVLGGVCWMGARWAIDAGWPTWLAALVVSVGGLTAALLYGEFMLSKVPGLRDGKFRHMVRRARGGLLAVVLAVAASFVASAIWEAVNGGSAS